MQFVRSKLVATGLLVTVLTVTAASAQKNSGSGSKSPKVLTGQGAAGDWSTDAPGVRRRITPKDLPKPFQSESIRNGPKLVPRPEGALPLVPSGFKVEEFASGFRNPRLLRVAPNGDLFVAESRANLVRVLRPTKDGTRAEVNQIFVADLKRPFGIAFFPAGPDPQWIYIGNTDSIVRFPYRNGDLKPRGPIEVLVPDIPGWGELTGGGHWTRDIAFSPNGKKMFVSVGSRSNVHEDPKVNETDRATILEFNPDGTGRRVYASGIRNAVGIAVHPETGDLWGSVNERDGLGDDLVPDYITRIKEGGFYGWPWYYIGPNQDPRHAGVRPDLRDKVIVPDVLLQSHYASLQMLFYTGKMFPKEFRNEIFAAQHGSWNRAKRTGYKVIRVPLRKGVPTGEFEDFVTGFVTREGNVWGRPVGVAVTKDGSLLVSDDGSNTIWRVTYTGRTDL
jgi:glucose/arabinose dehydrogenase